MFEKSSKIQLGHDKQLLVKGRKSGKSNTHSFDTKKFNSTILALKNSKLQIKIKNSKHETKFQT